MATDQPIQKQLEEVKGNLLNMAGLVEEGLRNAIGSLTKRDSKLAQQVVAGDDEIDRMDNLVDDMVLKLITSKQAKGTDLRFLTTAMKIVTDLERMGDHAVNIAYRAISLNEEPQLKAYVDLPRMAEVAQSMVMDIIRAFVDRDSRLARSVHDRDDLVDALNDQIFRELITYTIADPSTIPRAMQLMIVSRCLERIADHATNIAENIIFIETGEVIRHQVKRKSQEPKSI